MPNIPVDGYTLSWRTQDNQGTVVLTLRGGRSVPIPCDSAQELAALAAILNESPVSFRTEDGLLFTGTEPVGGTG